ncbi:MAG TPA: ornithine cyclodeaminase family protein [Pseudonocardiaceae bacterium]
MPSELRHLTGNDIHRLLDLDTVARSQREAFTALWRGTVDLPAKIMHASRFDDSVVFGYLARLSADTGAIAKIGSVNPGNPSLGLPSVSALVIVFDPTTGSPVALLDGAALTTLRTAAGSAVAIDALARADATDLGVLGSGVQARAHVRAIARVRPLRTVAVWSPDPARRARAAAELTAELGIPVRAADDPKAAVAGLPIVATCTLATAPVLDGSWLAPGCTVVSIGSFEPDRAEVDAATVRRAATVVVDDPATAASHAGPIVTAIAAGALAVADLVPLGAVLAGDRTGRCAEDDIVFYNSVGLGIQDAAVAWAAVRAAGASQ